MWSRCLLLGVVAAGLLLGGLRAAAAEPRSSASVTVGVDQQARDVIVIGAPVHIAGTVTDDVVVIGGDLTIDATARIHHDVYVLGGTLVRDPSSHVGGSVTMLSSSVTQAFVQARRVWAVLLGVVFFTRLVILFAAGVVAWQLSTTGIAESHARRLAARPVRVIGVGALWATLLACAGLVALLTVIALPVGVLVFFFLVAEGVVGLAVALFWIRQPGRFAPSGRAVLVVAMLLVGILPIVGDVVFFVVAALGLGVTLGILAEARAARRAALATGR